MLALGATAVVGTVVVGTLGLVGLVAGMTELPGTVGAGSGSSPASVPPGMLSLYRQAAAICPGLSWTVLAAIGTVESSNGTSTLPGVHSGANSAGAEGPMQFEPSTFAEYDLPVPPGGAVPPSPYDPVDAVYAATRLLCANGAAGGGDVAAAVFAYNHSTAYVETVIDLSVRYGAALGP
jgi:hypothetical protein